MSAAPSTDWKAFTRRVGAELAHQRRLKGLSQQQVGEAIGVEPETISRMETGVISPSLKRLCQLAQVLDCPVETIMGAASRQPHTLLNRLGEQLSVLSDRDRGFVIRQSLALAQWLAESQHEAAQASSLRLPPPPLRVHDPVQPGQRPVPSSSAASPREGPGF